MSYAEYGGRAYVHGCVVDDRADVRLTPDVVGDASDRWEMPEGGEGLRCHVLLGDGRVLVRLYKQSFVGIYRLGEEVPLGACIVERMAGDRYSDEDDDVDPDPWRESGAVATFVVDGHRVDVLWTGDGNHFVHARLVQPDGTVWTGWSGFGVGKGLQAESSPSDLDRELAMEAFVGIPTECPEAGGVGP